jgi:molybdenum cofactor biosynthesis protein MoaC
MIDISHKSKTLRTATARARVTASPKTLAAIRDRAVPKGDPLEVAKVAAVQAVKSTSQIIPYCHPLAIDFAGVEFELGQGSIEVRCTVKAIDKTGVEMEALTGAAVAALTLYDMLKMLDDTMVIEQVALVEKKGGKSDFVNEPPTPLRAAVLVMSDSVAAGRATDSSGLLIAETLRKQGVEVADYRIVPDDLDAIVAAVTDYADRRALDLVLTTGGTGLGPRDCTPEAMSRLIEREAPGIVEAARAHGQQRTPYSMLSRGRAGLRGKTLIVNLPGSKRAVAESLAALFPGLLHAFKMLRASGHG